MALDYPQILLKNRKPDRINTLEEYRRDGGYAAVEGVVAGKSAEALKEALLEASLLGRGGAGFRPG